MSTINVGIRGIGIHLPQTVRKNDWWPESTVQKWRERQAKNITRSREEPSDPPTEGMRRTLAAMASVKDDPFEGAIERRVMAEGMQSSDMETLAAREAIAKAGIDPSEIDILLVQSTLPNFIHVPNCCIVHRNLGLSETCFSMSTEGMCNAFLQQLVLAEGMISRGQARYALIIQSCNMTSFVQQEDPFSAWFGDGAAATIVGPVPEGQGILGHAHVTDGSVYGSIVTGVKGKRWIDDGPVIAYLESPSLARLQFLKLAEQAKPLVEGALEKAGLKKNDVQFWACHQATPWLSKMAQDHIGLDAATRVDTFTWAGSLSGANIPLVLATGEREGLLKRGDVVAMFSGAAGMEGTGMVMRWAI